MSKRFNTAIFMFVMTIINIAILIGIFFLLMLILSVLPLDIDRSSALIPILLFVLASVFSFGIFKKMTRFVIIHFHLEDKLEPLRRS